MYGVLAEADSDADFLRCMIRRLAGRPVPVKKHAFHGGAKLLKDGAQKLRLMHSLGASRFVICHDADGVDVETRRVEVIEKVRSKVSFNGTFCILIPKQELEAWILADLDAVSKVISSFRPRDKFPHPENVDDPKEKLEKLCSSGCRPLYSHAVHNAKVAEYLDLGIVLNKCPSFEPLDALIRRSEGNC